MEQVATVTFWLLIGLGVSQACYVSRFLWVLFQESRRVDAANHCPKAAVILCLRGADPFLKDTLEGILNQDYPRYDLWIVVDHQNDPAWQTAEEAVKLTKTPRVQIRTLGQRRDTCTLKCSSLIQAVREMDDSYEVVALVDADTIPHRDWLRQLVAPLGNPAVGVATGNRWYMPTTASWGAVVRYLWNAGAAVGMFRHGIPWGGTLALKTEIFRNSDLLQRWGSAYCEDTMLYKVVREQGLRVAFAPSLMMVNRETCDLAGFSRFLRRQLLGARLYHPSWSTLVVHGVVCSLLLGAATVLLVATLLGQQWQQAASIGAGLIGYVIASAAVLAAMEVAVRRIVGARGQPTGWLRAGTVVKVLAAIPLTQAVYSAALISSVFLRTVEWRGILYRVGGPWQIRLTEYRPYEPNTGTGANVASL